MDVEKINVVDLPPAAACIAVAAAVAVATTIATILGATTSTTARAAAAEASAASAALPVVAARGGATASPTSTTAATATAVAHTEGSFMCDRLKPRWDFLVSFAEKLKQITDDVLVAAVEECGGYADVTSTASTTNTVDVVVDVRRKIVVDDVSHIGDVEATSSDCSSHQNGSTSRAESLQCRLTLALRPIAVNRRGGNVVGVEEVRKHIRHALRLNEHERQASLALRRKDVQEDRTLVVVLDVFDLLGDVLRSGTNTADRKEDIVLHEVASKNLDIAGEGGTEHESLAVAHARHVFALHDATNLRLETHVEHAISLIQYKVANVREADTTALDKVNKTSRSGTEHVTATLDLT